MCQSGVSPNSSHVSCVKSLYVTQCHCIVYQSIVCHSIFSYVSCSVLVYQSIVSHSISVMYHASVLVLCHKNDMSGFFRFNKYLNQNLIEKCSLHLSNLCELRKTQFNPRSFCSCVTKSPITWAAYVDRLKLWDVWNVATSFFSVNAHNTVTAKSGINTVQPSCTLDANCWRPLNCDTSAFPAVFVLAEDPLAALCGRFGSSFDAAPSRSEISVIVVETELCPNVHLFHIRCRLTKMLNECLQQ